MKGLLALFVALVIFYSGYFWGWESCYETLQEPAYVIEHEPYSIDSVTFTYSIIAEMDSTGIDSTWEDVRIKVVPIQTKPTN